MMGETRQSWQEFKKHSLSRPSHGLAEDHFRRLIPGGLASLGNPSQSDPHGRDPFKLRDSRHGRCDPVYPVPPLISVISYTPSQPLLRNAMLMKEILCFGVLEENLILKA
jgi:hypothetical protein